MSAAVDEGACSGARQAMRAARAAEHGVLQAVAELVARGVAAAGGYRSCRRLLEDLWHLDAARARRLEAQAALLVGGTTTTGEPLPPALPATAAAHADGLVEDGHLRVVATTMEHLSRLPGLDADVFAAAERTLAEAASTLSPAGLEKVARRLVNTLDPDGAAPAEEPEPCDEVHLVRRRDGSLYGTIAVHGRADAELVAEVFDRLSAPAGPGDTRSLPLRRAEVLADLCAQAASPTGIASLDDPPDDPPDDGDGGQAAGGEPAARRPRSAGCPSVPVLGRALLAVTIDHRWLRSAAGHGLLDSEHALDPATARRLACDAGVVPMVLGTRGEPLDVGRLAYTVPYGMRRALHVRDGGCTFPGCTRRPRRCHAHHVEHWVDDGATRLDNLTLLCRYHHHLVHHDQWRIDMIDSRPWYVPPRWIDPRRRPRPGGRHPLPPDTARAA